MKNQYFGDNKDLFKYDLIYHIIKAGLVNHFMFIPILTENDDTEHGEDRNRDNARAGTNNRDLVSFLNEFQDKGKRDIRRLEPFFKRHDTEIAIYKADEYFSHEQRHEYFDKIPNQLSQESLVFLDPDNGLEVQYMKEKENYVRYEEVQGLYNQMDMSSILMIFQYFPREGHQDYLRKRSEQLKRKVGGDLPLHIDDGETIFFFLTKENELLKESLGKVITKYGEAYDLRVGGA